MLRLTLYKNCRLNNNYKNVFSTGDYTKNGTTKTMLEWYLESLEKEVINVENVYQELEGTFVIDYNLFNTNIYSFNYMKVETIGTDETVKILRYCFINDIVLKNEMVYLDYNEDIWSSYSKSISGINNAWLKNSRVLNYSNKTITLHNLPLEYAGNKPLTIKILEGAEDLVGNIYVTALLKIQFYHTDSDGNLTERYVDYTMLVDYSRLNTKLTLETALENIRKLIINQSASSLTYTDGQVPPTTEVWRYQITDVYIIPWIFGIGSYVDATKIYSDAASVYTIKLCKMRNVYKNTQIVHKSITNNFKNRQLGTFNTLLDMKNNGETQDVYLLLTINDYELSLKLSYNEKLIDIIDDFKIDFPILSETSEALSLRRMNRVFKDLSLKTKNTWSLYNEGVDLFLSQPGKSGQNVGEMLQGIGSGKSELGMYGSMISATGKQLQAAGSMFKNLGTTANSLFQNKYEMIKNNARLYTSNTGISGNMTNLLNSVYGLIMLQMNENNGDYVQNAFNEFGYETYEYLDDISKIDFTNVEYFKNNLINYNVIAFNDLEIYGNFTQSIASELEMILTKGVRIFYNETMDLNDNLTVE